MSTREVQEIVNRTGFRKDKKDWVTGDEPAQVAQLSYLSTLSSRLGVERPQVRTKREASEAIEKLIELERQRGGPQNPQAPAPAPLQEGDPWPGMNSPA